MGTIHQEASGLASSVTLTRCHSSTTVTWADPSSPRNCNGWRTSRDKKYRSWASGARKFRTSSTPSAIPEGQGRLVFSSERHSRFQVEPDTLEVRVLSASTRISQPFTEISEALRNSITAPGPLRVVADRKRVVEGKRVD